MYEAAADELRLVKGQIKALEEKRTAITDPLNKALRRINDLFRPVRAALESAEAVYKSKLRDYDAEQERIAREAQAKAEQKAREERERLQRQADELEAKGKFEAAVAKREASYATLAPAAAPATPVPKLSGVSSRSKWRARVLDDKALARHLLDTNPALFSQWFSVVQGALDKAADAQKSALNLPGVEVYEDKIYGARAK
jgi:regulator of protease activity HflC (stomatin/prohibitin superfamily)